MFFRIQTNNGLAIYDQVVRQIKFAVANRTLDTGQRVPSVRELSKQLAINPNTVARAYRQLQDEGVLESVRGLGLQVTVTAAETCRAERVSLIRQRLADVLDEARQSGLTDEQIQQLVHETLSRPSD
jgi:GntR family transcriptional regulator